ncbi:CPBP family intramembrane glutamic endopeptidase [Brachybacterium huguangmaarense]
MTTPLAPAAPRDPRPGTPYHRLATLRPEWSRWWRPVLTILATLIAYSVIASLLLVASVLALSLGGAGRGIGRVLGDPTSPLDVALAALFGAAWIPAVLLGVRLGGWRPTALLASVAGRVRGDLVRRCAPGLLVVVLAGAVITVYTGMHLPSGVSAGRAVAVIALVLLLAPLRAIGEELVFRGVGQQAIGTWLRHPLWAILLPVPFELIGRGLSGSSMLGAAILGLACGYLAWKTGGLEASILLRTAVLVVGGLLDLSGLGGASANPVMHIGIAMAALVLAALADRTADGVRFAEPRTRPTGEPVPALARV